MSAKFYDIIKLSKPVDFADKNLTGELIKRRKQHLKKKKLSLTLIVFAYTI